MAGKITVNEVVLGDSVTPTNNFLLKTNQDGSASLLRNADGSGGEILGIDVDGTVNAPTGFSLNQARSANLAGTSRISGVTYTNTTKKPITVLVTGWPTVTTGTGYGSLALDNATIAYSGAVSVSSANANLVASTMTILVPPGSTYSLTSGNWALDLWYELS